MVRPCCSASSLILEVISGTNAEILAIQAAGELELGYLYVVTDPPRGGEVYLQVLSPTRLSREGTWYNSFDPDPFHVIYDFENNEMDEVKDNQGNIIIGNAAHLTFPYALATITNTWVRGGGSFVTTLTLVTITNSVFDNSTVTWANTIAFDIIESTFRDSTLVFDNNATDVRNTVVDQNGTLSLIDTTGAIDETIIRQDSTVILNASTISIYGVNVEYFGRISATVAATLTLYNGFISSSSIVSTVGGDLDMDHFYLSEFAAVSADAAVNATVTSLRVETVGSVNLNNSVNMELYRCTVTEFSDIIATSPNITLIERCVVSTDSLITSGADGAADISGCSARNNGTIDISTSLATHLLDNCDVSTGGTITLVAAAGAGTSANNFARTGATLAIVAPTSNTLAP